MNYLKLIKVLNPKTRFEKRKAVYLCSCGKKSTIFMSNVLSKHTRSCGHLRVSSMRKVGKSNLKHGHARQLKLTRTYRTWVGMRNRCQNKNNVDYKTYGGRGIYVCSRWNSFEVFLEDMGLRPKKRTLDRIDNNRGYYPGNCRWATARQQTLNRGY